MIKDLINKFIVYLQSRNNIKYMFQYFVLFSDGSSITVNGESKRKAKKKAVKFIKKLCPKGKIKVLRVDKM